MNPVFVISVTVPVYESGNVSGLTVFPEVWESHASFILGRIRRWKFSLGFLSAQRNCLCRFTSLVKKEVGIFIGRALKKYSNFGRIVIFSVDALPNHENSFGDHFFRSFVIKFSSGLKLL